MQLGAFFLNRVGVITGKDGIALRRECLVLAQNNYTDALRWLQLPLWELGKWIEANNLVVKEREAAAGGRKNTP